MPNPMNGHAEEPPRVAIAYLAFDRHRLARLTLERVLRFKPKDWAIRIWQDGEREPHSGRIVGDAGRIARNLQFFHDRGLDVEHTAGLNKGTAITNWQAERWAFETAGADICIFIEDDIVISRHFFTVMNRLARLALNEPRVGAFSAFGDAGITWAAQWRRRRDLQPMHHRWGYGITRAYWLRTRAHYQEYLRLLENHDYRDRPNQVISAWLGGLHHATSHITGQDGARTAIMLKLGCFSIMTTPSYAVNIGKRGMHSFPEFYQANVGRIRGRHADFPWATRLPGTLSAVAVERLDRETRDLVYW